MSTDLENQIANIVCHQPIDDHWDVKITSTEEIKTFRSDNLRPVNQKVFLIGQWVSIQGLESKKGSSLNGLEGEITHYLHDQSRYEVRFEGGYTRALKACNLVLQVPSACHGGRVAAEKSDSAIAKDGVQAVEPSVARAPIWVVLSDLSSGGLLVRTGKELNSSALAPRLLAGSRVEQLELVGNRMYYRMVAGEGPDEGWVSIAFKGVPTARKE
eukprot:gnl/TRDRNA2_/TRDRNA2_129074_c1_seq2.p1 gnl/TRDRNA2_/TRDRNA2_129074_c1~~gnl/TRDRNA2_/TRDRNA2_129074_c1_seq2.p1  ORF type:complete len:232 (+),score=36.10 gnl/TRDRNA2_/TRDRNA2_129074_c1_seq2:56-697(+)